MGRPFIGNVRQKDGYEDMVLEKRSIFRTLKKFYGKETYKQDQSLVSVLN